MEAGAVTSTSAPARQLSVGLLVVAVALAIVAVPLRLSGVLEVMDEPLTPGDLLERGRLAGARAAVLAGLSIGLGWIGALGASGRTRGWVLGRVVALVGAGAVVSLVSGLWLTGLVLALAGASCAVLRRRSSRRR
ncbi:hypothetical protein ACGIF2_15550 [Cellulomonas sp. P22]|uniref:hypothetical protein n=1 Tax=Cellulomonas sp. P22 TaxID=3373189 RepID=UPI00378E389C